jgi:hypothetical protein
MTEEKKLRRREYMRHYSKTLLYKQAQRRYRDSERGKEHIKQYTQLPETKAARKRWRQSPAGLKTYRVRQQKRYSAIGILKNYLGGCIDCGYNGHPMALEFDHKPGSKKVKCVGQLARHPWHVVLTEIAKCDVVCANCHRVRTANRRK